MTPAGTSNELDVQNGWEENTHTLHIASAYQQYTFKFKTREEDPSLINASQKRNVKLLVDPIEQSISCLEQDEKQTRGQCDKELTFLDKQNHPLIIRRYISANVFFKINRK